MQPVDLALPAAPARAAVAPARPVAHETLQFTPRVTTDPVTGRRWTQITSGPGFCYQIYYFEPATTADGGIVLFYRYHENQIQNWKLELATGIATRLTNARTPNCMWRFWDESQPATGVRELLTGFSPGTEQMTYFDSNTLRSVHVRTLEDRVVYELSPDRVPCGLPGMSPDGRWFVFPHADRAWWEKATQPGPPPRHEAQQVCLDVVEVATGEAHTLVVMNSWITHANFYDNQHVMFCHPPTEAGLLFTDLRGGWYTHLRTQKSTQCPKGWQVNHKIATRRGIMYEGRSPQPLGVIGIVDPHTKVARDFLTNLPISHVGCDREGRFWFGDCYRPEDTARPPAKFLAWLPRVEPDKVNPFTPLTQPVRNYGRGQRSHLHPVLLPNREQILMTGPDHDTQSNHLFLIDVSDLADAETQGVMMD